MDLTLLRSLSCTAILIYKLNVTVTVVLFLSLPHQLLNQFENTGPPPADRDKIKSLPTVQVTEEHVGTGASIV